MAKSTFGEHLKREREMRGVSLDEISSATRIGMRFLEALESEQWDRLPGGVFNRGFVRAVARFLGLNEENLVAEYALATDDQPEIAVWAGGVTSRDAGRRSRALSWLAAPLVLALVAGGWFAWRRFAPQVAAWRYAAPELPKPARPTAPPLERPDSRVFPAPASLPEASRLPPAAEPATLELTVAAGRTTAVSVVADGKSVFDGKMTAGKNQHFQAKKQFEISAGNSSALLLELNGRTVAPMGTPGRPGKVTLTRKDLREPPGGPD